MGLHLPACFRMAAPSTLCFCLAHALLGGGEGMWSLCAVCLPETLSLGRHASALAWEAQHQHAVRVARSPACVPVSALCLAAGLEGQVHPCLCSLLTCLSDCLAWASARLLFSAAHQSWCL